MEDEDQPKIKKIITTIDDEKSYSIDVDETTTFYEFKKILSAAAHLLKNCFRIYHKQQEYTNDYDDNTIQEMFPDLNPIPLRIISNKDINEFEDELISVRFNINFPCQIHIGKYKMMYCFSCNKSICMDCLSADHRGHQVEEKADYLAPAKLLMNNIFSNSNLYRADSRLSKYMECVNFRSNLKLNIFDNLRKMINDLEIKFNLCLEFFSKCEDETEKNTNENLELLKKYCIECFIKLKNDINTKGIIIDDEIFLTLYRKLKEIERYKTEFFQENKIKYEKLNTLLAPFIQQVEQISEELRINIENSLNKNLYENFKNLIQENIVEKIQKETVNDFMFKNLGVPRKSLVRKSLGNLTSYSKKDLAKGNNFISPNKIIQEQKSPFQRANLSAEKNINQVSLSKTKNNQQEITKTWNKTEEINNSRKQGFNFLNEKNDITKNFQSNKITTTTTVTTTHINTNINNTFPTPTGMFNGKLVDVLSNEINTVQISDNNNKFLFIYPLFDTNSIVGAFPDETTAKISINFSQVFKDKDFQIKSFPKGGAFCNKENFCYFTGGQETQNGIGKMFIIINTSENNLLKIKMNQMPSMLYSHFNHSMICYNNYIIVIGGYNTNKCEAFNLTKLKWESLPDLNSAERQRTILNIYGDYLYAFMGYNQFGILDSVERININELSKGNNNWEIVKTNNPYDIDLRFYGSGVYCLNEDIYFIGGKKGMGNEEDDYKTEIYYYNFNKKEFSTRNLCFSGHLEFIENEFHHINGENIGNFINNDAILATLPISSLLKSDN